MSETVHYIGKLKLVEKLNNETLEEQCKRILGEHNIFELESYCDSWEEMLFDELYDEYLTHGENVYKVMEMKYRGEEDVFEAHKNKDGTISYEVVYYNGGCSFDEAIVYALNNME